MSTISGLFDERIPLPPGVKTVTVLIADGDVSVAHALRSPLEDGGYVVLTASTERQALHLLYNELPDLVMLGSCLNEASRYSICQRIKSDQHLGFLPVILLAETVEDAEHANEDVDVCPDAVLLKPVELSEAAMWVQSMVKLKAQYDRKLDRLAHETRRLEVLRTEIITNISHELSTPLLQVKSAIAMLAEVVDEQDTPEQARLADMATQAVARLEHEINNIKQLARTHDVRLGPVLIADTVERTLRHLERGWKSRDAVGRITVQIEENLPFVLADKRGLARLLQVLLDNALKFSRSDDPVWLYAEYQGDNRVWIGVRDTGIGIPPEEQEHIFDAFYKVDGSATQRYGGSGTGLALAALLANGMNITIEVDSEPGVGSIFSFVLPVVDPGDYLTLI